ncbi:MAG TPA: hypothetical protein VFW76_13290 [Ktedonobacterales bacterium]|nr:hypothetical protein [Ktedonobacterales bacterium]
MATNDTIGGARMPAGRGADDPYGMGRQARGGGLPALELMAGSAGRDGSQTADGLLGALLEIVGAEGDSLAGALAAWQREQDRVANRAWRRPGGLARPAGL